MNVERRLNTKTGLELGDALLQAINENNVEATLMILEYENRQQKKPKKSHTINTNNTACTPVLSLLTQKAIFSCMGC